MTVINPREEFRRKNLIQWEEFLKKLFENKIPAYCKWTSIDSIISVLNQIGAEQELTHTFFPSGGGLDLTGAATSHERGCVELLFSGSNIKIVKPQSLSFHSFEDNYEWAYFRLETDCLELSGVYEYDADESNSIIRCREELTEISPGNYIDRGFWDENEYEGEPLPDESRIVTRYLNGAFVIFAKGSIYNIVPDTYDARHNKMNSEEFNKYIANQIQKKEY